ncbi:MAG: PQQ-dependent sugar dehydrogenase [Solirubrobacterales bacterium]
MNRCTDADRRRRSRRARCSLPALVLALAIAAVAAPASYAQLQLVPFGGGAFSAPYHVAGDPTDPGRVFVAEQAGRIRLVENGVTRATPFLDINTDVLAGNELATGSCECGLFSVAFAPDYAMSGRFYVYYTRNFGPLTNAQPFHDLVIEEFRRSAANPDVADPSTRRVVLVIPHRANSNHNGGQLQFGPDGHLYLATGDGGGGNDPANNAQNLSSLLGKLLRIDPVDPPGAPAYSIPPDNPFAGPASGADEIYAYGLRNPYRFSFDRLTGDLVIGDVG